MRKKCDIILIVTNVYVLYNEEATAMIFKRLNYTKKDGYILETIEGKIQLNFYRNGRLERNISYFTLNNFQKIKNEKQLNKFLKKYVSYEKDPRIYIGEDVYNEIFN